MSNRHPILGRGESYVKDIEKRYYGGPQKLPHTYQLLYLSWKNSSQARCTNTPSI